MAINHSPADPPTGREDQVPMAHRGHGWTMVACGIPSIVVVGALVVTGLVSAGLLLYALACLVMMIVMMKLMNHGGSMKS